MAVFCCYTKKVKQRDERVGVMTLEEFRRISAGVGERRGWDFSSMQTE